MPEVETDPTIGTKCMILDYSTPILNLNNEHLDTPICKKHKLEEPLTNLALRLNQNLKRYKKTY
jgi:hypothetical protein